MAAEALLIENAQNREVLIPGFEPSVQLSSLARHYREHKEVKSGSQSLRFVIAKNSSTELAKSDLSLGSGEKAQ